MVNFDYGLCVCADFIRLFIDITVYLIITTSIVRTFDEIYLFEFLGMYVKIVRFCPHCLYISFPLQIIINILRSYTVVW